MNEFLFYNYLPILANHILDIKYTDRKVHHNYPHFNINNIKKGDIIFVKVDLLPFFFSKVYPFIKVQFNLISGVGGKDVDPVFIKYLFEDKIIKWFGCNIVFEHPKILKIPIGFEENELAGGDQILLKHLYSSRKTYEEKNNKLLLTKMGNTHKSRIDFNTIFSNKPFVTILNKRLNFKDYMEKINEYKFVLCPRGCGTDTHRFWEVLLMNSIPIVETSGLNTLYNNFPCIIVNSFKDINFDLLNNYKVEDDKIKNIETYLFIKSFNKLIV